MCVPGTIRVCTLHVHVHTHTGTTHTGGAWALREFEGNSSSKIHLPSYRYVPAEEPVLHLHGHR